MCGILSGLASGCSSLPNSTNMNANIHDPSINQNSGMDIVRYSIREPAPVKDKNTHFQFKLVCENVSGEQIIYMTPAPVPFGLLYIKPGSQSTPNNVTEPLYLWSDDYSQDSSYVSFDGEFTVASGLFPVSLEPGTEVVQTYKIRSDLDLGPIRSDNYSSSFSYEAQKGVERWNQGSNKEKVGFRLSMKIKI